MLLNISQLQAGGFEYPALRRLIFTADKLKQSGFTGAVRAYKPGFFALLHAEGRAGKNCFSGKAHGHVLKIK